MEQPCGKVTHSINWYRIGLIVADFRNIPHENQLYAARALLDLCLALDQEGTLLWANTYVVRPGEKTDDGREVDFADFEDVDFLLVWDTDGCAWRREDDGDMWKMSPV